MDIGNRIIALRQMKNMSTNKLANEAGISQSYLREIELGQKNPTVEILTYICFALGISIKDFFTEEESSVQPFLLNSLAKLSPQEQLKLADFINELKKSKN